MDQIRRDLRGVLLADGRQIHSKVNSPKQELWLESQGQIDFYDDPTLITPAADAVAAFCAQEPRR